MAYKILAVYFEVNINYYKMFIISVMRIPLKY